MLRRHAAGLRISLSYRVPNSAPDRVSDLGVLTTIETHVRNWPRLSARQAGPHAEHHADLGACRKGSAWKPNSFM